MKKFMRLGQPLLTFCCITTICSNVLAQTTYTWDGSSDSNWNTSSNWTPSGVPGSSDHVIIVSATNAPMLSANVAVANFTMTSGTADLNGYELTAGGNVSLTGGQLNNGLLNQNSSGTTTVTGVTVNCELDLDASDLSINSSRFQATVDILKTNGPSNTFSGNTWEANTTIGIIGSSAILTLASSQPDTFLMDATFSHSGRAFSLGNSADVVFAGSEHQTMELGGSKTIKANRVRVNKPDGRLYLDGTLYLYSKLTFIKGIIEPQSGSYVYFQNGASASSASNASYVEGPVEKRGNQAFTFPVGHFGFIRPISISAPGSSSTSFIAEYFEQNSDDVHSHTSKDGTINEISRNEYWSLQRTLGSNNVKVKIGWDSLSTSCGFSNTSHLRVTAWNGTQWKDLGSGTLTGTNVLGTIETPSASSIYGVFTLATTSSFVCARGGPCVASNCDIVGNGTFETTTNCGAFGQASVQLNCWDRLSATPEVFVRGCTANGGNFNTGTSTQNSNPASDTHNGSPNDNFIGIYGASAWAPPPTTLYFAESGAAQSNLTSPLIPGENYILRFKAKVNNNYAGPSSNQQLALYFGSTSQSLPWTLYNSTSGFPSNLNRLVPENETWVDNDNAWHSYEVPFVFNGSTTHNNLIIAMDIFGWIMYEVSGTFYCFIDDVSIQQVFPPEFATTPSCGTQNNGTATVTPDGGATPYTYLWDDPSNQTTATATGLSPGTYNVTMTDVNGCQSTWPVEVELASACCAPSQYPEVLNETFPFTVPPAGITVTSGTTIANQNFAVNGIWTVTSGNTLVLNNCDVSMGTNAEIMVENGAELWIENSTHIHGCTDMWEHIYVENGGEIRVRTNSLIEDGLFAVSVEEGADFNIQNSTFNRNFFHFSNFYEPSPINGPGSISNTQFRCQTTASLSGTAVYQNLLPPYSSSKAFLGVYVNDVSQIIVNNCDFSNAEQGVFLSEVNTATISDNTMEDLADVGIHVRECGQGVDDIDILNNTINRTPYGIFCYDNPQAELKIQNNEIDYDGITTAQDTMTGIFVVEITPGDIANPNTVSIHSNEVYKAPCGIHTMNHFSALPSGGAGTVYIGENEVSVFQPNSTGTDHSGILAEVITLGTIIDNEVYRYNNDVNWWETAIRIQTGSVANQVICNNTHDIGNGLYFDGDQRPWTTVAKNVMEDHATGIVMNWGKIGQQGSSGSPNDNEWLGTGWSTSNPNTMCYGASSDGTLSEFFVRSSYPYNPQFNEDANLAPAPITVTTTTGSWTLGCAYNAPSFKTEEEGTAEVAALTEILSAEEVPITEREKTQDWTGRYGLYKSLLVDEQMRYADQTLTDFYQAQNESSMGKLHRAVSSFGALRQTEGTMAIETSAAEQLNVLSSLETDERPEQRLVEVMRVLYANINDLAGMHVTDQQQLRKVANLCPLDDGFGVYIARAALLKVDTFPRLYASVCEDEQYREEEARNKTASKTSENGFSVYPNPSNGNLMCSYHLEEDEQGTLRVYSIQGGMIFEQLLTDQTDQLEIDLTHLSSGIYVLNVNVGGENRLTERLSILRE